MRHYRKALCFAFLITIAASVFALSTMSAHAEPIVWTDTQAQPTATDDTLIAGSTVVDGNMYIFGSSDGGPSIMKLSLITGAWTDVTPTTFAAGTTAITAFTLGQGDSILLGTKNDNGSQLLVFNPLNNSVLQYPVISGGSITEIPDIAYENSGNANATCFSGIQNNSVNVYCKAFGNTDFVPFGDWGLYDTYRDVPNISIRNDLAWINGRIAVVGYDSDTGHGGIFSQNVLGGNSESQWDDITSADYGTNYVVTSFTKWQGTPVATFQNTSNGTAELASFGGSWDRLGPEGLGYEESYRRVKVIVENDRLYVSAVSINNHEYFLWYQPIDGIFEDLAPIGFTSGNARRWVTTVTDVDDQLFVAATSFGPGPAEFGVYTDGEISPDTDGDGVPNAEENSFGDGDNNDDGFQDSQQANIATVSNPVTGGYNVVQLLINFGFGCEELHDVSITAESDLATQDSTRDYPLGLVNFTALCDNDGDSASVSVYFDRVIEEDDIRKVTQDGISTAINPTLETTQINGESVTAYSYVITDGGELDQDGQENSEIVDPVGPATLQAAVTTTTTPTTTTTTVIPAPSAGASGTLPSTGATVTSGIVIAVLLMGTGALLTKNRRRKLIG